MNYETNRLNTFSNWPNTAEVDPIRIAKAGFYHTGQGLEVQCFSCGGKISEWNYGDQVMARHMRLDPHCPFVVDPLASGNVPLVLNQQCTQDSSSGSNNEQDIFEPVHDYGLTEDDELYKSDALRLLSFVNWTDSSISRESLVSAGFYHAGSGCLRCAWCGGELASMRRLGSLGTPLEIHRRYFPGCLHAASIAARDAATTIAPRPAPPRSPPRSPDSSPANSPPIERTRPPQSDGAAHNSRVLSSSCTWRSLGVVGGGGAKHPTKSSLAARLATYANWPRGCTQTPEDLADAGFYYTGVDDQVRCFYCDGGLGKWEAMDAAWAEHAKWFPSCQYLLLVRGRDFVERHAPPQQTNSLLTDTNMNSRRLNFPVTNSQVSEEMESPAAMAALGAGLDAARVRRAILRRFRTTGVPFSSSEALIDAVLDDQLNEEAWSVSPQSQRFARDILAETLREFAPNLGLIPTSHWEDRSDSRQSDSSTRSHSPLVQPSYERSPVLRPVDTRPIERPDNLIPGDPRQNRTPIENRPAQGQNRTTQDENRPTQEQNRSSEGENISTQDENRLRPNENRVAQEKNRTENRELSPVVERRVLSLEEENRQLKEARLCKVCMDSEVSVVFLPCGHLAACAACGASLAACPLCRAAVSALVRAYLA